MYKVKAFTYADGIVFNATMPFLPRIGEHLCVHGINYRVDMIKYHITEGTSTSTQVDIVLTKLAF